MLQRYVEAGFDPDDFWALTLRLYQTHMRGAAARLQRQQDEAKAIAWLSARMQRAQKLPPLEKILRRQSEEGDIELRLAAVRAALPVISMAEYQARRNEHNVHIDHR